MTTRVFLLMPAVVAGFVLPAFGQANSPAGRLLASNCFQCHGTNGNGPGFDRLAGKSSSDIYDELREMRTGKEGQGLMTRHSMIYTDAQLRLIAQWFAAQPAR
jgi:cytochrome subunit of sulfide dehydrogenase